MVIVQIAAAGLKHRSWVIVYQYWKNPNPFLMLTLVLRATLRQFSGPIYYTTTIFRLKVSMSKDLGYSSIGKTMTCDLRFRPAKITVSITLFSPSFLGRKLHLYQMFWFKFI